MAQSKILLDSNSYFRLAKRIHPLLFQPFGEERHFAYTYSVRGWPSGLSEQPVEAFAGEVFRATRKSLDPLASSTRAGRWDEKSA